MAIGLGTLTLAVHALWLRPFAPAHEWKGPVRAALLVLCAACAAVNAWASAVDARGGSGLAAGGPGLSAAAYLILVLFCVTILLLVAGVGRAMLLALKREQVRLQVALRGLSETLECLLASALAHAGCNRSSAKGCNGIGLTGITPWEDIAA